MPVTMVITEQGPGFRWGRAGKVYSFDPESPRSRKAARAAARAQGRAIRATGWTEDGKPPAVRRLGYPRAYEASYERALLARVRAARRALESRLLPEIDRLTEGWEARLQRQDSASDDAKQLIRVIEAAEHDWRRRAPVDTSALHRRAKQVGRSADRDMGAQLGAQVGRVVTIPVLALPDIEPVFRGWIASNVDLITSIDERYFADVRAKVEEYARSGRSIEDLKRELLHRYEVSESRARLIARDQTAKLNGQVNHERQAGLGVTHYIWRTSQDERVRDSHSDLNGLTFAWSDPPDVGDGRKAHPGFDFACRCVADPVLSDAARSLVSAA